MTRRVVPVLAFTLLAPAVSLADEAPSFAKQIKPFFTRYCVECHPAKVPDGGLSLHSFKGLMTGGDNGPVLVPGKPDKSKVLLVLEGKVKPMMPPKRVKERPKKEELALLRAWIAAGAKDDSAGVSVVLPIIKARTKLPAPVTSLAYTPDGKTLAAVGYKEVLLIEVATGDVRQRISGQAGKVSALAFGPAGKRLAVAISEVGKGGEVRLYEKNKDGWAPGPVLKGHTDVIYGLAFSPDGKLLASCGYDRLIKLWDVSAGRHVRDLKDHSDAVYGLAFSPDGLLLASASADRAVKVWEVATGKRLYTLGESTDWVYAVAWSPDGKHVAAGGVDKSIRVWAVSRDGGEIVRSVFAHEGPVAALVYSKDGKTLYSLGEDRRAKAWDAARMVERKLYPEQPEAPLALAVRPDGQQLAIGRYDGALVLLDEKTGKLQSQPLPVKPKPVALKKVSPDTGRRGQTFRVTLEGGRLDSVTELTFNTPGVKAAILSDGAARGTLAADLTFPANTPAGVYQIKAKNAAGESNPLSITIDPFPQTKDAEPNDSPRTGQPIQLPATVAGRIDPAGQVDFFRFEATVGQQVGVQVLAKQIGSKLAPVLELMGPDGQVLAESGSGVLGHTCQTAGTYALGVRDRDYRGGADMTYRLHVGDLPVVTAVFPLGVRRGSAAEVRVEGVNLGDARTARVNVPADARVGSRVPVKINTPHGAPLGDVSVVVGEYADVSTPDGKPGTLRLDSTGDGRISHAEQTDVWRFSAKKGEAVIIEVHARRAGSPLDSFLEILDARGEPLPRATLRSVAKTYTTFRDHDSAGPGIRLEAWSELAVNDYLYVGGELLRIRALPKNPDDDCQFFSEKGRRRGFLGTTPNQLAMGTPMYKVTLHPPGATFPPNGFPLVTLYWRNDDGGPDFDKDSVLFFDPPADGEYQVRVGDARGQASARHAYRLTLRRPRPDFTVSVSPKNPSVWKGGAVPITVKADRRDGFAGEIAVKLENLPAGFSAPPTAIPAGEDSTAFTLQASEGAASPNAKAAPLKLVARAMIGGKEVTHEASAGLPKAVPPGDIVTTTDRNAVSLQPGGKARLTVTVERRNGFKGRIPIDVRGLPHGIRVLDIGLNGILITPDETQRTVVLYCEPWVEPTEHPVVVLARQEAKKTEHAAPSVLLKVGK